MLSSIPADITGSPTKYVRVISATGQPMTVPLPNAQHTYLQYVVQPNHAIYSLRSSAEALPIGATQVQPAYTTATMAAQTHMIQQQPSLPQHAVYHQTYASAGPMSPYPSTSHGVQYLTHVPQYMAATPAHPDMATEGPSLHHLMAPGLQAYGAPVYLTTSPTVCVALLPTWHRVCFWFCSSIRLHETRFTASGIAQITFVADLACMPWYKRSPDNTVNEHRLNPTHCRQ
jgi:hypothetical protein